MEPLLIIAAPLVAAVVLLFALRGRQFTHSTKRAALTIGGLSGLLLAAAAGYVSWEMLLVAGGLGMAVTANQVIKRQATVRGTGPVYASTTIYEGSFCFVNTTGYVTGDTDSGASRFAGIAVDEFDNSSGASADIDAEWFAEGVFELPGSGFTQADVGKEVFASDNYTITLTDSSSAVPIGVVQEYVSATALRVKITGLPNVPGVTSNVLAFTGSTGANEIRVPDNLADGLSIEGTHGDFIVFATTDGSELITVSEATTFTDHVTFSGAIDVTFSGTTGQCEIKLTDNLADALSIGESTNDYIVFVTTNGSEKVTFSKDLELSGAIDLSFVGTTGQSEIMLTTNLADALSIKDSAADIIVITTTTGSPAVVITPATTVSGKLTATSGINFAVAAVTADGSNQGDAVALTAGKMNVVAGGDDSKGVILPTAATTEAMIMVLNSGSAGLKIYPASSDKINNGSANAAITILENTMAILVATAADNWAAVYTVNS